jgi:transposase-like protein
MKKLLDLQNVIIYSVRAKEKGFLVKIGQPHCLKVCPFCASKKIHKHGKGKQRMINHGSHSPGKLIWLVWQSERFKCSSCEKTFTKKPPQSLVKGRQGH